ncbi:hypothetical protein [Polaribacter porphyrae]|uniref:Uncharacterized protein n=1 Tax=Polaribacter porphyrae TaxID=1137780 RepID=A0A2S7WQ03_9FLAO|nr:hypothetical protein [Polaribacter porphyrae]PQJ79654.1 hypothetical protein BTO18_10925 [Polaribacter porphyrae]
MHKKLEADLISLAHSILKMKNKEDVFALKDKAKDVYEKLSMLAFVEEYVNVTPNLNETKSELEEQVITAFELKEKQINSEMNQGNVLTESEDEKIIYNLIDEPKEEEKQVVIEDKKEVIETKTIKEPKVEEIIEQPFDELEELMFADNTTATNFKNDVKDVGEKKTPTLEDELQDTISVDVIADLFENAQPKSLNDKLSANIQIGLNDRIAFVKHLFEGDQENYNRVISQLNTFKAEKEAKKFIKNMVKPDYDWSNQEELETRFMEIITRKFA